MKRLGVFRIVCVYLRRSQFALKNKHRNKAVICLCCAVHRAKAIVHRCVKVSTHFQNSLNRFKMTQTHHLVQCLHTFGIFMVNKTVISNRIIFIVISKEADYLIRLLINREIEDIHVVVKPQCRENGLPNFRNYLLQLDGRILGNCNYKQFSCFSHAYFTFKLCLNFRNLCFDLRLRE